MKNFLQKILRGVDAPRLSSMSTLIITLPSIFLVTLLASSTLFAEVQVNEMSGEGQIVLSGDTGVSEISEEENLSETIDAVEQSVKFYSGGRLVNATSVEANGIGFVRLFEGRDRHYGSDDLVGLLRQAGIAMSDRYPRSERFQIGDLSARLGGKISGHASHQNGLDVDLSYYRTNRTEPNTRDGRGFNEQFVVNEQLTNNFDLARNWAFVKYFVNHGSVGRIFVGKQIKKAFCRYSESQRDADRVKVLRRLRPWPNHDNHLHLRLKCPDNSPRCTTQQEPPVGDSCADIE